MRPMTPPLAVVTAYCGRQAWNGTIQRAKSIPGDRYKGDWRSMGGKSRRGAKLEQTVTSEGKGRYLRLVVKLDRYS
jgi:hypothetical protein